MAAQPNGIPHLLPKFAVLPLPTEAKTRLVSQPGVQPQVTRQIVGLYGPDAPNTPALLHPQARRANFEQGIAAVRLASGETTNRMNQLLPPAALGIYRQYRLDVEHGDGLSPLGNLLPANTQPR